MMQFVQKYLAFFLDEILSFLEYIEAKIQKATVGVNLMCQPNLLILCLFFLTIYKFLSDLTRTIEV